ncbi:DUF58 domain-containing protein [Paenibacillus sp. PL2-23]|uniref:DUF58 domain-containing protein n=1 Tax=Paenibacillus sp. PL2-23 TaxID=2100729 RepID=UPI0030F6B89E
MNERAATATQALSGEAALKLLFPDQAALTLAERLRLAGGSRIRGTMAGKRRSAALGGSQEFADYRPYVPGDDTRRIDWSVYGRTGRAYIRQYWDEQELHAHLYIDTSRSMDFEGGAPCSKLLYALRLAALVGYAALAGDDRVTLRTFDDQSMGVASPILRGRAAFPKLYTHLAHVSTTAKGAVGMDDKSGEGALAPASNLARPFRSAGALPRRAGVTWLFTDALFEEGIEETLMSLASAGQQLVLVQLLSPEELRPSLSGELKLVDSELGSGKEVAISDGLLKEYRASVAAYQELLRRRCAELGAAYAFVDTGLTMSEALQLLLAIPGGLRR